MRTHNPERSRKSRSRWNRARGQPAKDHNQTARQPRLTHQLFRHAQQRKGSRSRARANVSSRTMRRPGSIITASGRTSATTIPANINPFRNQLAEHIAARGLTHVTSGGAKDGHANSHGLRSPRSLGAPHPGSRCAHADRRHARRIHRSGAINVRRRGGVRGDEASPMVQAITAAGPGEPSVGQMISIDILMEYQHLTNHPNQFVAARAGAAYLQCASSHPPSPGEVSSGPL